MNRNSAIYLVVGMEDKSMLGTHQTKALSDTIEKMTQIERCNNAHIAKLMRDHNPCLATEYVRKHPSLKSDIRLLTQIFKELGATEKSEETDV